MTARRCAGKEKRGEDGEEEVWRLEERGRGSCDIFTIPSVELRKGVPLTAHAWSDLWTERENERETRERCDALGGRGGAYPWRRVHQRQIQGQAREAAPPLSPLLASLSPTVELGDDVASVVRSRGGNEREEAAAAGRRERRLGRKRLGKERRAGIVLSPLAPNP